MTKPHLISPKENWKPVPKWSDYEVSNLGKVRSLKFGKKRILKPWLDDGYPRVRLSQDGKRTMPFVHCLVLEAFVGPRPKNAEACHFDGTRNNNAVENLRWDTNSGNQRDKVRHGTDCRGNKHPRSELTNGQVLWIYRKKGKLTQKEIAERVGLSRAAIANIHAGRSWSWLTKEAA